MPADMHVERCRIAAQHVIVDRRDFEAVLDQLCHHRIDLGLEQHEVAHHHGAAMRRLERRPAAERERGADGDTVERDLQIGARKPIAMNVAGYRGRGPTQRFVDLFPIDLLRVGDGRQQQRRAHDGEFDHMHRSSPACASAPQRNCQRSSLRHRVDLQSIETGDAVRLGPERDLAGGVKGSVGDRVQRFSIE